MLDRKFCKALLLGSVSAALVIPGYSQSATPLGGNDRTGQTTGTTGTSRQDGIANDRTGRSETGGAISQAIEMNAAEVEAGKMASSKAENAQVKQFADMMVKDHTDALTKLRALPGGTTADATINAKHKQTGGKLSKLSGAEFDREYMKAMVSDHQEAVKFFERQSGRGSSGNTNATSSGPATESSRSAGAVPTGGPNTQQPSSSGGGTAGGSSDLSRLSQELLPTVRHHLELAEQIQRDLRANTKPSTSGSNSNSSSPNSSSSSNGGTRNPNNADPTK